MEDNLLIVGGSGFIGSSLVKRALDADFKVTVISLHQVELERRIANVNYLQVDIGDINSLKDKLLNLSFNYVVNLSGYVDHSKYLSGGHNVINTHFNGLQNLIRVLDWTKLSRFIQIGSSDEYGCISAPQFEYMKEAPISSYSIGKLASTRLLQMLYETEDFPAVVLRLFLVYGEGQNNLRFIPQVIEGCLRAEKFSVSEGRQLRDFCHIDDVTSGIIKSLEAEKALGEVINLASGKPVSIMEVVTEIQNIIGTGVPEFGKIAYRKNENMELYANIDKANKLLDWRPKIKLSDGLKSSINFYRSQN